MTEREALNLALEALELSHPRFGIGTAIHIKAVAVIKEALAQQALDRKAENARELGLDYEPEKTVCPFCTSEWVTAEQHDRNVDRVERKPLTDEEIKAIEDGIWKPEFFDDTERQANCEFARDIEAAHGIKGEA